MIDDSHDSGEFPKRTEGPALREGLPVAGYRVQSGAAVNLVNANKDIEERVLRILDDLAARPDIDKRWLAIGRSSIEQGFMAVNRAVFRPERVELADVDGTEERGWVIELGSSSPASPLYFAVTPLTASNAWTAEHSHATRFARREDAEAVALYLTGNLDQVRICEHSWS